MSTPRRPIAAVARATLPTLAAVVLAGVVVASPGDARAQSRPNGSRDPHAPQPSPRPASHHTPTPHRPRVHHPPSTSMRHIHGARVHVSHERMPEQDRVSEPPF